MTILIDPPVWPGHGRVWSHVISDVSFEELHEFARRLGVPPRGFEGDHYDIPAEHYQRAIDLGAVPVSSRELIDRLRNAGLRRRKRLGEKVIGSYPGMDGERWDVVRARSGPPAGLAVEHLAITRPGRMFLLPDPAQTLRLPTKADFPRGEALGAVIGYLRRVDAAGGTVRAEGLVRIEWSHLDAVEPITGGSWHAEVSIAAYLPAWISALVQHRH